MECWKAIQGRLKVVLEGLKALQGILIQKAGRLASRPEPAQTSLGEAGTARQSSAQASTASVGLGCARLG